MAVSLEPKDIFPWPSPRMLIIFESFTHSTEGRASESAPVSNENRTLPKQQE